MLLMEDRSRKDEVYYYGCEKLCKHPVVVRAGVKAPGLKVQSLREGGKVV